MTNTPPREPQILEFANSPAIPDFLIKDVRAKLAYIDEAVDKASIVEDGARIRLVLKSVPDESLQKAIEDKVARVVTAMVKGAFEPRLRSLEDHMDRLHAYDRDPMDELLAEREVVREGNGYYTLGPKLSRLIDYMESRFLWLAGEMQAEPYRFPALIPAEYMERVKYFSNFPHSLSFVSHLREDLEVIEDFAQHACCSHGVVDAPDHSMAAPGAMLTPTVCHHLYYALADQTIPMDGMTVTAYGHCFRYESSNMISLERLWNFTMREIIFVGPESFVKQGLEKVRKKAAPIFADLGLAYRIENASDPFFIGTFTNQTAYQNALELKFEIRALLPFKNDTVAVGSYNRHQTFFGTHLNIHMENEELPHTGCVGFGYERLAFAFVAQHGTDPKGWPEPVRAYMDDHAVC